MTRLLSILVPGLLLVALGGARADAPLLDDAALDRATLRLDVGAHTAALTSIAVGRDGRVVATGSEDRTVRLWEGATGALLRTLRPPSAADGNEGKIFAVAISPDGRLVAAGGITRFFDDREQRNSSVYLFDTSSGALVRRLPGTQGGLGLDVIKRIVFSPDGNRLVAPRGRDHTVGIYDTRTGAALDQRLPRDGQYVDADFAADGRLLLCQLGGRVRLYDPALQLVSETQIKDQRLAAARFTPDGKRVVAVGIDGRVELLGSRDLRSQRPLPAAATAFTEVTALVMAPDGTSVAVTGVLSGVPRPVIRHVPLVAKSPPRDEESPSGVLRGLTAFPGGGLAFAARDGSWGVSAPGRALRKYGGLWALDAQPESLLVDPHGEQVELRLGPEPSARLRFRVPTLELQLTPGVEATLQPARTELPSPYRITGWRHQRSVMLNDRALQLIGDNPAALAVAPDQRGFALGTDRQLLGFLFAAPPPGTCPYVSATENQLKAPCFARQLASGAVAVNYSGDGRWVVALHEDGTLRWYDSSTGSEQLALWVRPSDPRWVLFRPDGRYAAAPGSAELVGWQINRATEQAADFFPLSRLRAAREFPDEVAATLTAAGKAATARPARMLREQLPPVATLLEPVDGSAIAAAQVTLKVAVRSPTGQPITAVTARIDGRPAGETRGIMAPGGDSAAPQPDGAQLFTVNVALPPRDCVVSVTAQSAAGPSVPAVVRLRWRGATAPSGAPAPAPALYVLAIGVGDYQRPELQLRYPAKDARDLAALLGGQKGPGRLYDRVEQRVLTDRQASKAAVLEALDWLQHRAGPTDTTVLFLAGHGLRDPASQEYYFLPADAEPNQILKSMLPASTLQQILGSLPGRVLLLLDTCHAGGVLPGRRLRGLPAHQSAVEELASAEGGVVVMAAATGAQASAEDTAWQNGAFTKALLEGLGGRADLLHTGRVTVNMLDLYVSERVRALTAGSQTPATAKPSTIADFPLVTIPTRAP